MACVSVAGWFVAFEVHVLDRSAFDAIAASPTTAAVLAATSSWTPTVGGLISDSSDLMTDVLPFDNAVRLQTALGGNMRHIPVRRKQAGLRWLRQSAHGSSAGSM